MLNFKEKFMFNKIKIILLSFFFLILLTKVSISNVFADVGAAPVYSQGGSIQSSLPSTNVSMDYEKVILTYGSPQRKYSTFDGKEFDATMPVHVSAVFKMKNNGSQTETMNVYFPSNDSAFIGGWGGDDLTNFKVNGKLLSKDTQTQIPITIDGKEEKILAYQWSETFNGQQITEITVEYDTKSGKDYQVYYLTYVLGTGRAWQGNIRQGEISFVLPENLSSYSILNKAPMVKENKIPFKVSGNTVTVNISEYEPNSDDAIVLGVYEFNIVNQIEQLKKETDSFTNTLKIAGLFRQLSGGPHCAFCTGVASENAKNYYNSALNKASSKEELNFVLKSFAYGDGDWGNVNDLLKMISLSECETDNNECKASVYMDRDKLGETPFRLDWNTGEVGESVFLLNYAKKIQSYDQTISLSINKFISGAKAINDYWKQKNPQNQVVGSPTPIKPTISLPSKAQEPANVNQKQNSYFKLIIGLISTIVVVVLALIAFLIIRNKRKQRKQITERQSEAIDEENDNINTKDTSENKLQPDKQIASPKLNNK